MRALEYTNEVLEYLEYLGYPDYIEHIKPEHVAHTVAKAINNFRASDISPRMAALCIFGLTWWKLKENINISPMLKQ